MKQYLPIGTIVQLQEHEDMLFCIIGMDVENSKKEQRDYVATRYPVGLVGNARYYFFNQEDIGNIVHHGFVNEDHETDIKLLDALHRERREERDEGNI